MHSITIFARGENVYLHNHALNAAIEMEWQRADALARTMRLLSLGRLTGPERIDVNLSLVKGDNLIMLQWAGSTFLEMTPEIAIQIANFITVKAREAEEMTAEAAERTILDGALLFRLGTPLGLTDNAYLQKEITNEAAWGKTRKLSDVPSIRSSEIFGTPSLRQSPPPQKENDNGN